MLTVRAGLPSGPFGAAATAAAASASPMSGGTSNGLVGGLREEDESASTSWPGGEDGRPLGGRGPRPGLCPPPWPWVGPALTETGGPELGGACGPLEGGLDDGLPSGFFLGPRGRPCLRGVAVFDITQNLFQIALQVLTRTP